MQSLKFLPLLFGLCLSATWDYKSHGPSTWGSSYSVCSGSNQSPIDVDSSSAEYREDLPLKPTGYDSAISFSVSNSGHGITFSVPSGNAGDVKLVAKDLYNMNEHTWNLLQFHFHWGTSDSTGSENKLDGTHYPMEVHLVHANTKYTSGHTSHSDGLLVLGFFFEVESSDTASAIAKVVSAIPNANNPGDTTTSSITMADLIPSDWQNGVFYSWQGSLTTPGCFEAVSWYLFKDTIKISPSQMEYIRSHIYDDKGGVLDKNWRPVQSLGSRKLYTSSGNIITNSLISIIALSLVVRVIAFIPL